MRYQYMRSTRCIVLLVWLLFVVPSLAQRWQTDVLGPDFNVMYFNHAKDYSGQVRSSLVTIDDSTKHNAAILYIHGFNDYFYQKELAYKFRDKGYAFYAVDLRKYGRSLLSNQKKCQVRDYKEYIPDIDSAVHVIKKAGYDKIVLMGHSNGGLVASYYIMKSPDAPISALILNSPFLDWNLGALESVVNLVSGIGVLFPNISLKSGSGCAYGESLHSDYHGEWNFNTDWKSIQPINVDLGWVRAVNSAQHYLRKNKFSISIPILLMYSSRTINAVDWSPEVDCADVVLDVDDIRNYGLQLGIEVSTRGVVNGKHDLFLSSPEVRERLYESVFDWLSWKL